MMKKMLLILFAISLSLSSYTFGENNQSVLKSKKEVSKAPCKKVTGFVGEATSMHFLEIKPISSNKKDTIMDFTIDDNTNTRHANLVIGNIVEVWYKEKNGQRTAVKIVGSQAYVNALGTWTMPDPINKKIRMEVELDINGKARSIRMATLPYTSWELWKSNQLLLHGKSIGNHQTFDITDTVAIYKVKNVWVMKNLSTKEKYYKSKRH